MEYIVMIVLLVVIAVLTVFHFFTHNSKFGNRINRIPGPPHWPIIGNLSDFLLDPETLWDVLRKTADNYYPIYKLWLGSWSVVNIRHPDDVEVLLTSQKNINKSFFYKFLHPWLNEGLLTSTGNKWRGRRKTLTPAFHFNVLEEFAGMFVENSERMVKTLKMENGEVVKDVAPFLAKFTFNAICETAMGTVLQDNDAAQVKYRNSIKQMGCILYHRILRPWLVSDWIFSFTQKGREQKRALNTLHEFTVKIIEVRKKYHERTRGQYLRDFSSDSGKNDETIIADYGVPLKKKRLAMLDLLIAAQKDRSSIDDLGIREEVDTFVFEGHDTTNMALTFALFLLAENEEIQRRARAEIDSVLKNSGGKIGISEIQSLNYLDRCIKESLRMYPSVPVISREITDDMYLKNFLVPRGTIANVHIFDVHRDPNFWPEPHVYDPDRFLPHRSEGRHPFSYVPFSGGPRNCIGQKFAMLEMKVFIGLLLHNYYLKPVTGLSNVRILSDLVLESANPLNVKFVPVQ